MISIATFIMTYGKKVQKILLDGCLKITERGLQALPYDQSRTVSLCSTGVSFHTQKLQFFEFDTNNCPLLDVKYMTDEEGA